MIYQYEAKVLEHVNKAIPEIKESTYAKDISMFQSMSRVVKFPSLLYSRVETDWTFPAIYTSNENGIPEQYSSFDQTYIARIYVANQADALRIAGLLRFYWLRNSYVTVPFNKYLTPVGLRLLYTKVSEERAGNDKIGPQRYVELSWSSRLFYFFRTVDDDSIEDYMNHLVEEVHIYLRNDGIHVLDRNNLIAIVK